MGCLISILILLFCTGAGFCVLGPVGAVVGFVLGLVVFSMLNSR